MMLGTIGLYVMTVVKNLCPSGF